MPMRLGVTKEGEAMHQTKVASVAGLVAVVLVFAMGIAPAAAFSLGEWNRDNYGTEHEQLMCREATPSWTCHYNKVPTPGFSWDDRTGVFSGRNVTASWSCPAWFDSSVCDNVVAVYSGRASYTHGGQHPFTVAQEYIVTNLDGQAVLEVYWVNSFYCPWYRTWAEALAADNSCTFAP